MTVGGTFGGVTPLNSMWLKSLYLIVWLVIRSDMRVKDFWLAVFKFLFLACMIL